MEGDLIERKLRNGGIDKFYCIVKRGTVIRVGEQFTIRDFTPLSPIQTFKIYYKLFDMVNLKYELIKKLKKIVTEQYQTKNYHWAKSVSSIDFINKMYIS